MAQSKMIDFAKATPSTKSIVYYGAHTFHHETTESSCLHFTVSFLPTSVKYRRVLYSKKTLKKNTSAVLPATSCKMFVLYHFCITTQKLIILVALENGNTRIWFVHHYNTPSSSSSNGYYNTPYNNGKAMVLLLELVQVVEVQEIVILAEELVNIGKKLGNIQKFHIRRK